MAGERERIDRASWNNFQVMQKLQKSLNKKIMMNYYLEINPNLYNLNLVTNYHHRLNILSTYHCMITKLVISIPSFILRNKYLV